MHTFVRLYLCYGGSIARSSAVRALINWQNAEFGKNSTFRQAVKLPYLRPHALWICGLFVTVTLLVSAAGPVASLKMMRQFSKAQDALNAREE